jgi:VanZ family protein
MLPLRYASRWRLASMMLLLLVLASMLMPVMWFWPERRELVNWFVGVDKWLHGMTFAMLALWFSGQYRRGSYWRIGAGLIAFGIFIEACQRLVTYRSADWFDVVANTIGIVTGLLIAAAGLGGWSLRLENWLARAQA